MLQYLQIALHNVSWQIWQITQLRSLTNHVLTAKQVHELLIDERCSETCKMCKFAKSMQHENTVRNNHTLKPILQWTAVVFFLHAYSLNTKLSILTGSVSVNIQNTPECTATFSNIFSGIQPELHCGDEILAAQPVLSLPDVTPRDWRQSYTMKLCTEYVWSQYASHSTHCPQN